MQALDTTCLDNTASYETKFPLAKKAAGIFVDNIMSLTTNQVRVGVIDFGIYDVLPKSITPTLT